mmetsp:Transcript_117195/g.343279  ORF Transcript_117195/g.343279 Transcript_117195/m.343279 type:complete len:325 (-) Transcript_117195:1611-2585(-)
MLLLFDFTLFRGRNIDTSEDDVHDVAVHRITHNLCKDRAAEANEGANHSDKRAVQKEALSYKCPATVGVQYGNAHWHVSTSHTTHQVIAHCIGQCHGGPKGQLPTGGQEARTNTALKRKSCHIQQVLARQTQWCTAKIAVQLTKCHKASRQRHTTDEVTNKASAIVKIQTWYGVCLIGSNRRDHCCQADQRVEGSHRLWQCNGLNLHAQGSAQYSTTPQKSSSCSIGLSGHAEHRCCQSSCHTANPQLDAHLRCAHAGEATNGANAKKLRDDTCPVQGRHASNWSSNQCCSRNGHEIRVVFVTWSLEEVEHSLCDNEASNDVHS